MNSTEIVEYEKIIRGMIEHENELINHRLTWLCQIQGFLFAALAVTWNVPDSKYIRYVFCFVGFIVAVSSIYGLHVAKKAIIELHVLDKKFRKEWNLSDDLYPPVIGFRDRSCLQSLFPWVAVPWILAVVWVAIAFMLWNSFSINAIPIIVVISR